MCQMKKVWHWSRKIKTYFLLLVVVVVLLVFFQRRKKKKHLTLEGNHLRESLLIETSLINVSGYDVELRVVFIQYSRPCFSVFKFL